MLFIRICADLLRERLPYDEILTLLSNDTENKTLSETIREIQQDLKDGRDGNEVFGKHADVLGRFTAYMLSVASTSGNMAEVYESTAKFLERDEEFKKSLKSALIMPTVIVLVLLGAVFYYVAYIFPATAEMFLKFGIDLPPMTRATLDLSNFMRANIWGLLLAVLAPITSAVLFFRTPRGRPTVARSRTPSRITDPRSTSPRTALRSISTPSKRTHAALRLSIMRVRVTLTPFTSQSTRKSVIPSRSPLWPEVRATTTS